MMSSSSVWQKFSIAILAGVVVDKLLLAEHDAWAFAVRLSNQNYHPFLSAFLWTLPQVGSAQLMTKNFHVGKPYTHGVVVGDGQTVTSIIPLLTEWLFCRQTVPRRLVFLSVAVAAIQ